MTTAITTDGKVLEVITDQTKKVQVSVMADKHLHGLVWYSLDVFEKVQGKWFQMSRGEMAEGNFDIHYGYLTKPEFSEPDMNGEHISFDAFKALVISLK